MHKKGREHNLESHLFFVDCEMAFDKADTIHLGQSLENKRYPEHMVQTVQSFYQNTQII
jgi:hypothetical protein